MDAPASTDPTDARPPIEATEESDAPAVPEAQDTLETPSLEDARVPEDSEDTDNAPDPFEPQDVLGPSEPPEIAGETVPVEARNVLEVTEPVDAPEPEDSSDTDAAPAPFESSELPESFTAPEPASFDAEEPRMPTEAPAPLSPAESAATPDEVRSPLESGSADEAPTSVEARDPDEAPGPPFADPRGDRAIIGHDSEAQQGFLDHMRKAFGRTDGNDHAERLNGVIDRPDFQDPTSKKPESIPDRYGTPLDRPDGTRTPLFDGEPRREQTKQGGLGDCGIIATLGAVAQHHPEAIRNCVNENDDGTYSVRLHEAVFDKRYTRYEPTGKTIDLTVTPDLPVFDELPQFPAFADSVSTGVAWAPVLEKAIAGLDQTWSDERKKEYTDTCALRRIHDAPEGYVRLNRGSLPSDRAELLTQLTGLPAKTWELPQGYDHTGRSEDRQLRDEIRESLDAGLPVLVGSRRLKKGEHALIKDLRASHAYEVKAVDEEGLFHLRDPHNNGDPMPLNAKEFRATMRKSYTTLEPS
ncbi:C2 family cysteine protease [Streptomyces sp. NBC_01314]|uniref:C2 family cysteine protease n=1 Tax=Streptomyces sp. NBC_01314 TaxID=2903821 RepID=UPI003089AD3C|nr:C2 family cysteine protease [Streptomyces sp. NBC_01314]